MPMLRLRQVGNRHEVSHGGKYVGDIDNDHLMDYVANLKKGKFSVAGGCERSKVYGDAWGVVRKEFAQQVRVRAAFLQQDNPRLSGQRAFRMATDIVLKQNPGAEKAYREDCAPLNTR